MTIEISESLNQIRFIHFLALIKENKIKNYVPRNGKMPLYEERDGKNGYSSRLAIATRKYLEGIFGVTEKYNFFNIEKERDIEEYSLTQNEYKIGTNEFIDSFIVYTIINNANLRLGSVGAVGNAISFRNHRITPILNVQGQLKLKYEMKLKETEQILIPTFFNGAMLEVIEKAEQKLKTNGDKTLQVLLNEINTKLASRDMFVTFNKEPKSTTTKRVAPSMAGSYKSGLMREYNVTDAELEAFLTTYRHLCSSCAGLERDMIFNLTKAHLNADIPNAMTFSFDKFSRLL